MKGGENVWPCIIITSLSEPVRHSDFHNITPCIGQCKAGQPVSQINNSCDDAACLRGCLSLSDSLLSQASRL